MAQPGKARMDQHKEKSGRNRIARLRLELLQMRRVLHAVELGRKRENGVDFLSL